MCEFLIRIVDKVNNTDKIKNSQLKKRGDVVVIVDDGWPWSPKELTNPDWEIKKFPGIPKEKMSGFIAGDTTALDSFGRRVDLYWQPRRFKFDLQKILPNKPTETEVLTAQIDKGEWTDREP